MTAKERRTYSRRYQQVQKALEAKYIKPVYRALLKYALAVAKDGVGSVILINEHISPVIRRLYLDAGLVGARKTRAELRTVKDKRASFGTNDELVQMIIEYLQRFILDKVVMPISDTTKDWVLNEVSRGIEEGKGAVEIAREIAGSQFLRFQALRIVRTEVVKATNVGAMKAMEASPYVVQKQWISARDNRTRRRPRDKFDHLVLDGQIVDFEQPFTNGLLQPGDPAGEAGNVINCRCTIAAVPKRDVNGRLIRKTNIITPTFTDNSRLIRTFLQTG